MAKNLRMQKVDEELKKHISEIISLELTNTNITGMITVTRVDTTPDLRFAKVYVSILGGNQEKTIQALTKSKGYIRSMIAKRVNLRTTPDIAFEVDDSLEVGSRVDELLKQIKEGKI